MLSGGYLDASVAADEKEVRVHELLTCFHCINAGVKFYSKQDGFMNECIVEIKCVAHCNCDEWQ